MLEMWKPWPGEVSPSFQWPSSSLNSLKSRNQRRVRRAERKSWRPCQGNQSVLRPCCWPQFTVKTALREKIAFKCKLPQLGCTRMPMGNSSVFQPANHCYLRSQHKRQVCHHPPCRRHGGSTRQPSRPTVRSSASACRSLWLIYFRLT